MSLPTKTQQWILNEKPYAEAVLEGENQTFKLVTTDIPALKDGEVLLKTVYLSNDPAQRGWISPYAIPGRLYMPPVEVGDVMKSMGIFRVVDSRSAAVEVGSLVNAVSGWTEYTVINAKDVVKITPQAGLPETHFLGALGLPGHTAYYGLTQIVKATSEDTVVVSGAAGAVGNIAIQIAKKMIGCKKVIGIAGTDEKCRWVEKLGADVCLNYKSASYKQDLEKETSDLVNVFFDNVAGEILDFMLTRMAKYGRVAACGAIANYNRDNDIIGIKNFYEVVYMRLQILGFINIDWFDHLPEVQALLADEWKKGKLVIGDENETVVDTSFKDIPRTWMLLFSGGNTGKLITKLQE
ncbi:hypothetical protein N7456_008712 [Penicillium angulare]|uniref:Enoyl reductase (ER) domain-containing protein n=1 Tax=Penicillium angulare TaxID=116970 RepID=A0A9W9K514_9EURO|nr:hypothetical protein N7456_008712 [Penicillium angulare]